MDRVYAYGVSAALIAVMFWPAFREPFEHDSFPHSTYPMFSTTRPTRLAVTHAVGTTDGGDRVPLSPMISSGNRAILQSQRIIRRGVHHDAADACSTIAQRVALEDDLAIVTAVELSTDLFDIVEYFEVAREPVARNVHVRCEVRR